MMMVLNSNYNTFDPATGLYNNIITNDLFENFDRTEMTTQVETTSIGIIYEEGDSASATENQKESVVLMNKVLFTPSNLLEKSTDAHGNVMS